MLNSRQEIFLERFRLHIYLNLPTIVAVSVISKVEVGANILPEIKFKDPHKLFPY